MVFSYFQKNTEFLHTDEIISWCNYEESFADGGSSNKKVKYGRQGHMENQEDTSVFLSPKNLSMIMLTCNSFWVPNAKHKMNMNCAYS